MGQHVRRNRPNPGLAAIRPPGSPPAPARPTAPTHEVTATEATLRAVEREFLQAALAAADAELAERRSYLRSAYGDLAHLPPGEDDLLAVHQRERALVRAVAREAEERPLFEVLERRLRRLQERLAELERPGRRTETDHLAFWQARIDRAILNKLMRQWLRWLHRQPAAPTRVPARTRTRP